MPTVGLPFTPIGDLRSNKRRGQETVPKPRSHEPPHVDVIKPGSLVVGNDGEEESSARNSTLSIVSHLINVERRARTYPT